MGHPSNILKTVCVLVYARSDTHANGTQSVKHLESQLPAMQHRMHVARLGCGLEQRLDILWVNITERCVFVQFATSRCA